MTESRFTEATPFRDAMRTIIGERWEAVWQAVPAAVEGSDIEGVHDVRVASRRLRAAMDVSREAFPSSWYRPLHRVAKEITSELGEVRDRDVQLEYFRKLIVDASAADQVGIQRLIDRLETEREAAREEMEHYLARLDASGIILQTRKRFPVVVQRSKDVPTDE